ncbi:FMN-linked oxidoreductase [Gymnopus androsaceus JB14]|uniref:FMN-linked oxidoreductase n=1 Tax=Gymnopus androsaceus JB14 TaxID=1447944 RepID=A0A6A4GZL1_9AGAR|nr:FMN-linked oxidoreductase [Gymnopus androsaceus JB14]
MASTATESNLFAPIQVGNMMLKHRRLKIVREYYSQRASTPGTLLITEGTIAGPIGAGLKGSPGIWSAEQIASWKEVVSAVHAEGSYIYLQIGFIGRVGQSAALKALDPKFEVVGAGDIPITGREIPRPLTIEEIKSTVELFAQAATDALNKAGIDGVGIHAANFLLVDLRANGYLVDQFIQDISNNRTDEYEDSVENRSRYTLGIVDAVVKAIGEERTAIRLSPWATGQGDNLYGDEGPLPYISQIRKRYPKLAYLHMIQTRQSYAPLIIADGFTREKAFKAVELRNGVLVAFRRTVYLEHLPLRLKNNLPLSAYDRATFYGGDESGKGYTDYAFALQ